MAVGNISLSISMKVHWDRAGIKLTTWPGSAISLATDCTTGPSVNTLNGNRSFGYHNFQKTNKNGPADETVLTAFG